MLFFTIICMWLVASCFFAYGLGKVLGKKTPEA